jgi:trehalose 6-phosphate synthase
MPHYPKSDPTGTSSPWAPTPSTGCAWTVAEHWVSLARHSPLGLLTDLDGTLIPFAATPREARPGPGLVELLAELATLPGLVAAVVSGRPREDLEALFSGAPGLLLVAEHGGWRRGRGSWHAVLDESPHPALAELAESLDRLAGRHPGALVERKTWSVALHRRRVAEAERTALSAAAAAAVDAWLAEHPGFERLDGAEVIEVRPARLRKSSAVGWVRERAGAGARLLAFGDDRTDEDTFRAVGVADEAIRVGPRHSPETFARWSLSGPQDLVAFLRWLVAARRGRNTAALPRLPEPIVAPAAVGERCLSRYDLLVVSNRLPALRSPSHPRDDRSRHVGGLVAALEPALAGHRSLWLGWSGRTLAGNEASRVAVDDDGSRAVAWVDFPAEWQERYYNGFCNRVLWPLLHTFPGRVQFADGDWDSYMRVNDAFAAAALELAGPDTPVWVHDYHLLLVARALRRRGHRAPIGLFLHVPFPGADVFGLLPWAEQLLDGMLDLDLIGFHTAGYADNFRLCVRALTPAAVRPDGVFHRGRRIRVETLPIGIIPESFQQPPEPAAAEEVAGLLRAIAPGQLVLGVDRLDYTKGIPERLEAFARLLQRFPGWRRKMSLVQVSVPSREDVTDYVEQRRVVESAVGRINGEFGEGSWVPVRYLYRSYGRNHLAQLYRSAAVGYVTPLRDGMNLVAKEYVAAQDPANPGVLVLSRFAGAAVELADAVLTNPWHIDGMAEDLDRALRMPLDERRERHRRLAAVVASTTAVTWARDFLAALEETGDRP